MKKYQFKRKDSKIKPCSLCLGSMAVILIDPVFEK